LFLSAHSQSVPAIKFKKSRLVYFFQIGAKTDTVTGKQGNLFCLIVPDSMKERTVINIENGQLRPTDNDSIVKLYHVQGIRYECVFVKDPKTNSYEFKTLVNGASVDEQNTIRIKITDRKDEKVDLENVYFFRK
jgi:hypothetical protein